MKKMFTLAAALIMAVCAWADTQTYSPVAEYNLRPKADGTAYDAKKEANSTNATLEINHNARFCAVQQYKVADLANATSMTLSLKGASSWGTDALAIWAANGTWTAEMEAGDFNTLYQSSTGVLPGTAGTTTATYLLKDKSNTKTDFDSSTRNCTFVISGNALKTLVGKAAEDGTITIIITNNTTTVESNGNSKRQYYSSGNETEGYRPTLTVTTEKPACQIGDKGYATLAEAVAACPKVTAEENTPTVITINKDVEISARINVESQNVTIKSATGAEKILRAAKYTNGLMFLTKDTLATITIDGVTIDGQSVESTTPIFEASNKGLTVLKGVTIQNAVTSATQGIFCNKSNGRAVLNGVTITNCTASGAKAAVFVGTNNLTLAGQNNLGAIYVEKKNYITNDNAEGTQEIIVDADREASVLVKNGLVDNYTVTGSSLNLTQDADNIYLGTPTGIQEAKEAGTQEGNNVVKTIKNGKMVIIKNNVMYNAAGAQIK